MGWRDSPEDGSKGGRCMKRWDVVQAEKDKRGHIPVRQHYEDTYQIIQRRFQQGNVKDRIGVRFKVPIGMGLGHGVGSQPSVAHSSRPSSSAFTLALWHEKVR